jgi:hypothetical protein
VATRLEIITPSSARDYVLAGGDAVVFGRQVSTIRRNQQPHILNMVCIALASDILIDLGDKFVV